VAKNRLSLYEQKRSREWLKIKVTHQQECVICGYTDPRGGRELPVAPGRQPRRTGGR